VECAWRSPGNKCFNQRLPASTGEGNIKHVIVSLDNVHFLRDNPTCHRISSQMPYLRNVIEQRHLVTIITRPYLTHANFILTLTSLDFFRRHGHPSPTWTVFKPDGTTFVFFVQVLTDLVRRYGNASGRSSPDMVTRTAHAQERTRALVPVHTYRRSFARGRWRTSVLEKYKERARPGYHKVFGAGSVDFHEALASNLAPRTFRAKPCPTDFVRSSAIHCANDGGICAVPRTTPELLPDD